MAHVELSTKPFLTIDEVQHIQRQQIVSLIAHVFRLAYAAMVDSLVHEKKMRNCHGCAIQHPSQRPHSCLMMDGEDAWMYYYDDVVEKIDLSLVLKTAESVCSTLGIKLGNSCEVHVTELPKFPWTNLYITSLEFEGLTRTQQPQDRILRALYHGLSGLKWKEFVDRDNNVVYRETVIRKDEESTDLEFIIADMQNKLCF